MMSTTRVRLVLLIVPVLWGLVFVGIHELLPYLDAFELVTLRFAIVTLGVLALLVFRKDLRLRLDRKGWAMIPIKPATFLIAAKSFNIICMPHQVSTAPIRKIPITPKYFQKP